MVPQTKVFIGSLPQGSKPEELRKLFERFGAVTECDIMNRCGFVHMQTEEQASAAIRALNNTTFNGGVISVERGRIKERGQRGGGGGGRGGMRGAMRGGMDRRGGMARAAPYPRDRAAPYMRGAPPAASQMAPRSMGYERTDRPQATGYDDRYNGYGYGGEDRRGFALMDRSRDAYAAPMYDDRAPRYDEMAPYDDRRAPMYDERDVMERRAIPATYDRPAPARPAPHPNGDMFSRRDPMHGGGAPVYDRDPYAQQYPAMGRGGGVAARGRDMASGMGPRRY